MDSTSSWMCKCKGDVREYTKSSSNLKRTMGVSFWRYWISTILVRDGRQDKDTLHGCEWSGTARTVETD